MTTWSLSLVVLKSLVKEGEAQPSCFHSHKSVCRRRKHIGRAQDAREDDRDERLDPRIFD
ncbi:hypothetical protein SESBI_08626 [Sesbania bispinosa]|nr:hypothetical protein SESBI_08626 [Sesbania bispinosa]